MIGCLFFALAPAGATAGMTDVKRHLNKADRHLAQAESLAERDRDGRAAKWMERANNQARRAFRQAKRMEGLAGARAEKRVAMQYDEHVDAVVGLIGELRPPAQEGAAEEITEAVDGREKALGKLTELLDQVPEQARRGLSKAIAAIQAGSGDQLDELVAAVEDGEIGTRALPEVGTAIDAVSAAATEAMARLQELAETLPPQARDKVLQTLERIEAALGGVLDRIGGGLDIPGMPGIELPQIPGLPGLPLPSNG